MKSWASKFLEIATPNTVTTFQNPLLNPNTVFRKSGAAIRISLGKYFFDLELDTLELADAVERVLRSLELGLFGLVELREMFNSDLLPYNVDLLLGILTEKNVLTEQPQAVQMYSGTAFYHEIRADCRAHIIPRYATEVGAMKFHASDVSAKELEAWTIEYYFTTRFAEQCLATALNHRADASLHASLEEFFIDEVGHDRLMYRSLEGFGYSDTDIEGLVPHISTVATMGMLLRSSIYDLPFFVTLVGQMEGSEAQSRSYIAMLQNSGLPQEAIRSQVVHEMINIEHDHFGEALELAQLLAPISSAEIERCKRQLHLYLEMRVCVYSHIFPLVESTRRVDAVRIGRAWAQYGVNLRKSLLPIAISNSPERLARLLARDYVELRKVPLITWDPNLPEHVIGALLEYSLWKTAYQNADQLIASFRFLDGLAIGVRPNDDGVPAFLTKIAASIS